MNYKNGPKIDMNVLREIYDEEQLEMMVEEDERSLVRDLVEYSNELIEHILELRREVNEYDRELRCERKENMGHYQAPYADLHSDILVNFSDHQVYDKFKDELDKMLN
jgi:hypothetical protein